MNQIRAFALLVPVLLLIGAEPAPTTEPAYASKDSYDKREVRGWTVYVSGELLRQEPKLAESALELLNVKLYDIQRMLPPKASAKLAEIPFWLELKDKRFPCACYHVSPDWLRSNGYNPEKAGAVEIANAKNFLIWTRQQPAMVLHELAHGYYHRLAKEQRAEIAEAYKAAREEKLYDAILRSSGRTERAYAMNNPDEYFAETTEAMFGENDFYPFVRVELQKHDPRMFELLRKLWLVDEK
jgi:hypothetical protein